MTEYACFFHPRLKSVNLRDVCPSCGREFGFPQAHMPTEIGDFEVEGLIGRGFYSVVAKVRRKDSQSAVRYALKITPAEVYTYPDPVQGHLGGYGNRRNPHDEFQLHEELSKVPHIVRAMETGLAPATFGDQQIDVWWVLMDLAGGATVQDQIDSNSPLSPMTTAQIALYLLDLKERLALRNIHHNDLHPGNVAIEHLERDLYRRDAIDESIDVLVFDIGSAAREDKSTDESRLDDMEQIARLILQLIDIYERAQNEHDSQTEIRLAAQLRRVAQYYTRGDQRSRRSKFSDMHDAIREAFEFAEHPEQLRQPRFRAIDDFYNAQLLPSEFARALMYDPGDEWAANLSSPGPQLVVGMRGCGKTMLLRSLEWRAQAVRDLDESVREARARLDRLPYVGLFVSCAYLLRGVRERIAGRSVEQLYLAYAREAVRSASAAEASSIGRVSYAALERFVSHVQRTVSVKFEPTEPLTLLGVERALGAAVLDNHANDPNEDFAPLEAFIGLTASIRELVDAWSGKTVIYLLDDVSRRFVGEDEIVDLLSKLCLKDESFGFKISTESQTELLRSPGGIPVLEGRDYQLFNLGAQVLEALDGAKGEAFLEGILLKRHAARASSEKLPSPRSVIGSFTTRQIAQRIKESPTSQAATRHYAGLRALAALCVGDIGDVIQIYQKFLAKVKNGRVDDLTQAEILIEESESRLLSLAPASTKLLYQHAAAFAQASHRALISESPHSDGSPRERGDVNVEVGSNDAAALHEILQLVGNGIFALVSMTQRTKAQGAAPHFQFRLRFRKLLGLRFGIPLGNRDRFELSAAVAPYWLANPTADSLLKSKAGETDWAFDLPDDLPQESEPDPTPDSGETSSDGEIRPSAPERDLLDLLRELDPPEFGAIDTGWKCHADEVPFIVDALDWSESTIIAATGFEDRAVGAWENFRTDIAARVQRTLLLNYPDSTDSHGAALAARSLSEHVSSIDVDPSQDPSQMLQETIVHLSGPIVIDVSAMTKSMIFAAVRAALLNRNEVWIAHTRAEQYEPSATDLEPVLERLKAGEFPSGLELLDAVTPGEGRSFDVFPLDQQSRDGSSRSLLALFATLKHARTDAVLRQVDSDEVLLLQSVHSDGAKNVESILTSLVADYAIGARQGRIHQVSAMDPNATYDVLARYYSSYALNGPYQMQLALSGTKMQTVGAAMFSAVASPSAIYYSASQDRDHGRFTHGTGRTRLFQVRRALVGP